MRTRSVRWLLLPLTLAVSCKDNGPDGVGDPTQIVMVAGTPQSVLAGTALPIPITVSVRDADGDGVPGQQVTFTITAGGGRFADGGTTANVTTDNSGNATAPAWTVGRSAVPQVMTAQTGSLVKDDIQVNIQSAFNITIRFYGPAMTAQQQELFTNAAARISAFVTGDIIAADFRNSGLNISDCGIDGQPNINEIVDDVLIYASIRPIDGQNNILAQAGPCHRRLAPHNLPASGVMEFDTADLPALTGGGSLQDVITHEMLHVLGFGTLWDAAEFNFVSGGGTSDPRYTGSVGRTGCVQTGGTVACATTVPLENQGGSGTADAHWREATFNAELMTGFLDSGTNPISVLTIGSLEDLGYVVNTAAADPYTIFNNSALRSLLAHAPSQERWERIITGSKGVPVIPGVDR